MSSSQSLRLTEPGVKRQGHEANHSPPTSAQVKKKVIYTSIPPYVFMAHCLISLAQEQLLLSHTVFNLKGVCVQQWCLSNDRTKNLSPNTTISYT
jgi:hypothetical protein